MENTYEYFDWFNLYNFYELTNNVREREYTLEALGNTRLNWLQDLYIQFFQFKLFDWLFKI